MSNKQRKGLYLTGGGGLLSRTSKHVTEYIIIIIIIIIIILMSCEVFGVVPLSLEMKLVLPSFPWASYASLPLWPIFQCLFGYPVCVHSLYTL
jgi:hypothetical protein